MKKIWFYLATFFMGVSAALLVAMKFFAGDKTTYQIEVKKIKNKRSSGTQSIKVPVEVKEAENKPKKRIRRREMRNKRNMFN